MNGPLMIMSQELRIMINSILYTKVQRENILVNSNACLLCATHSSKLFIQSDEPWLVESKDTEPVILRVKLYVLTHLILLVKRFYDYSHLIDEKIKAQRN